MIINSRIVYSILFYVLIVVLVVVSKPSLMFDDRGNIRPFGVDGNHTMISFGVVTVLLAILSFYIFCIIDLIFSRK